MSANTVSLLYRLRVDVLDSDPPIWRHLWVRANTPLAELHPILVAVMGWSGGASYQFKASGCGTLGHSSVAEDDRSPPLQDWLSQPGDRLLYTYNLTLGWLHRVVLEVVQPAQPDQEVPFCVAGERRCPPDFCPGVWGYEEFLNRLGDPEDPDSDALWAQVGYDFDPEFFDLGAANQRLQALKAEQPEGF